MVQGFGFFTVLQVYALGVRVLLCYLGFNIYDFGIYRVQSIHIFSFRGFGCLRGFNVKYFLWFFMVQDLRLKVFLCILDLGFTIFLLFRVQRLGFCRGFKWVLGFLQGLQDLGFLKVQDLGLQVQDFGFQVRFQGLGISVFVGLGFEVKVFIQVFTDQGSGQVNVFQDFIGLGFRATVFFVFLGLKIYDLGLYWVQR